ncbi:DUF7154 domain-containing protein [Caenorhabditis elegans]|uniref:DUF7154 domain-containing protein n=1 Tax=Caenorhabditis elegans TaxID=6239 RepID=O44523_CAEEL|nr:ANF_receptor domain-containing protein [Caenorhabditis elegans]CCD71573.2 ANF_receptor domain-containing protein [Caenorhabditis elegans]|eukprot:NP_500494.2 Uncharacterized protein CELE_R07C12.3 [Caenorhabditis elegans]
MAIFKTFANVRMDTQQADGIIYHHSLQEFNTSVYAHLPNPSLSYDSSSVGSSSLKNVEDFYDSIQLPLCGSIVVILSKRNPNENDISKLVAKIRSHHGIVHVIASNTPSGGSQPLTLYDLSSRTNGLTDFRNDDQLALSRLPTVGIYWPLPLYAENSIVSGNGFTVLPPLIQTKPSWVNFGVAVQNHGPTDTFQSFYLSWYNASSSTNGNFHGYNPDSEKNGTIRTSISEIYAAIYNMTLDYSYSDNSPIKIQIRLYTWIYTDYWLPYAD